MLRIAPVIPWVARPRLVNLFENPDFEDNITGVLNNQFFAGTLTHQVGQGMDGSDACRGVASAAGTQSVEFVRANGNRIPCVAGKAYQFIVPTRAAELYGETCCIRVLFYTSATAGAGSVVPGGDLSGATFPIDLGWTSATFQAVAPATSLGIRFTWQINSGGDLGDTYFWDKIRCYEL